MHQDSIVDQRLREIVATWRAEGMPTPYASKEETEAAIGSASPDAQLALRIYVEDIGAFQALGVRDFKDIVPLTPMWEPYLRVRLAIRYVIINGLARLPFIMDWMVDFGAVPDPETDWTWVLWPDGSCTCWECLGPIGEKEVKVITWSGQQLHSGVRTVENVRVGYCPLCGPEPQDVERAIPKPPHVH